MLRNNKTWWTALGLVVATVAAGAPAMADASGTLPAGCSISPAPPSMSGTKVSFGGSASCRSASSADFRLVHNYNGLPDVRVKNVNQVNVGSGAFSYTGATCDNGGTTQYYSEIHLYASGATQRVSKTVTLSHC